MRLHSIMQAEQVAVRPIGRSAKSVTIAGLARRCEQEFVGFDAQYAAPGQRKQDFNARYAVAACLGVQICGKSCDEPKPMHLLAGLQRTL